MWFQKKTICKCATNSYSSQILEKLARDLLAGFDPSSPPDQSEAWEVSHDHPPPPNHTPHHFLA